MTTQPDTWPALCLVCRTEMRQRPCTECDGTGQTRITVGLPDGMILGGMTTACDACNGYGWVWFCPREPAHGTMREYRRKS